MTISSVGRLPEWKQSNLFTIIIIIDFIIVLKHFIFSRHHAKFTYEYLIQSPQQSCELLIILLYCFSEKETKATEVQVIYS